ncbi:M1 family metallopeptidase [Nocardioides sp.]|uniref:M1 family metallopeptidase n=1 Tax=Nocardioides sp. TaxID=35761 RepID=UPI002C71AF24|nr:M1 family metallopeptidase [Nocardioides sp.]HVX53285.1 M1 family metallopeptidase [Nocardioides sp.]
MRSAGVLVTSLALLVGAGVAAPALAAPAPARVPVADGHDSYFPEDGNRGIDVQRYKIADAYDFASGRLSGTTTLTVTATQALSVFDLDLLLPVSAVSVDGQSAAFSKPDAHELRITPPSPIGRGQDFKVTVTYAGAPGDLCWQGECDWLADRHEVVTMNEPHMAAWWFPADDTPADAAKMDISITVPADDQVIANGRQISRTVDAGLATTRWKARDPMAPYLAFFAAGHFTVSKGRSHGLPWLVAVSDQLSTVDRNSALRLMRKTPSIVSWLSQRLGRYPFETVGGLTTKLDPGFALENQTRPTYPMLDDEQTVTVVHELAHQWFGDSVRLAKWRDVWLNEGFATFLEWYWTETHGGPPAEEHLLDDYAQLSGSFWRTRVDDPGAAHLWDTAVYERGAMALQALRTRVGDKVFWRILRGWAATRAGKTGTTAQFEKYAAKVAHQHLAGFFNAWVHHRTRPAMTAANGLAPAE